MTAFPGQTIHTLRCLPERDLLFGYVYGRLVVIDIASGDTLANARPGNGPYAYLLDQAEARFYCVNEGDDNVTVLDASTDSILLSEVLVGSRPMELCLAAKANKVYARDLARGSVYSLDCASGRIKALRLPGPSVSALCYDSLDNKIYVATSAESVYAIDCATDSVVAAIPTGESPCALCYNPLRNRVYSGNTDGSNLTVIDCGTDSAIASVRLRPTGVRYVLQHNPQRDEILCGRGWGTSSEIEVVDCATNRVIDTLPYYEYWIVYHSGLGKIYIGDYGPTAVVLDAASDSLVTTIREVDGDNGFANETDFKVYVVVEVFGSLVTVIDGKTDSVTCRITSIPAPHSGAHDVLNDKVYIPSATEPGRVFVLDGPTDAILDSIPVLGIRPVDAIWNPGDGRVYVCNWYSGSISVLRDSLVPGMQEAAASPRAYGRGTILRQLNLPAGLRQADIYDISGRRVARLSPGSDEAERFAPGVYFVMEAQAQAQAQAVRKIVVTR